MRPAAAVVAAAVACCLLAPAAAQMVSPLQGQNVPTNTSTVYFSFYLDRLLAGEWPRLRLVCRCACLCCRRRC